MDRADRQNCPTAVRMSETRGGKRKDLIMFRSITTVLAATAFAGFLSAGIASAAPDQPLASAAVTQQAEGGGHGGGCHGRGGGVGVGGVGSPDVGVGVGGLDACATVGVGGLGPNGNEGVGVGGM
ncbi:hypothetical protein K2224_18115 [Streptomyces sp. BHT-5-2]|uniref:hypothetical protein n=1 Tax=unclassified Streptomyces TaxID=2593676 RepID=UPI001C8DAFDC|nr:hypothetical protein [Streptomyces sp. BHT-5-2]QZL04822.1 hypothetical protein K2224_18115 [Streptomyces sp. BHT-5-2]